MSTSNGIFTAALVRVLKYCVVILFLFLSLCPWTANNHQLFGKTLIFVQREVWSENVLTWQTGTVEQ